MTITLLYYIQRLQRRIKRFLIYPRIFTALTCVILVAGYLVYHFEQGHSPYFHTWWDGIWFAVITSATVGYGDKYPVTVPGQIVTIALIVIGGSLLAVLLANIGGSFALRVSRRERGLLSAKHFRNHVVICHWNKQTKLAIIDYTKVHRNVRFVLIDDYLDENPLPDYNLHFIRGSHSDDETLIKAGIEHAKTVLIFGDKRIDETTADAKSMKAVLASRFLNPSVHIIVECLSGDVRSLERVGADEVINTGEINSRLLIQSTISEGISHVLQELLVHETGNELFETPVPDRYVGRTFGDIAAELRQKGVNLIALGGDEKTLNPLPETVVSKSRTLVYIARSKLV